MMKITKDKLELKPGEMKSVEVEVSVPSEKSEFINLRVDSNQELEVYSPTNNFNGSGKYVIDIRLKRNLIIDPTHNYGGINIKLHSTLFGILEEENIEIEYNIHEIKKE